MQPAVTGPATLSLTSREIRDTAGGAIEGENHLWISGRALNPFPFSVTAMSNRKRKSALDFWTGHKDIKQRAKLEPIRGYTKRHKVKF